MVVGRFAEITSVVDFVRVALAEHGEDLTSENSSMIYAAWMSALVEQGELDEARRLALAIRPERQSVTAVVSGSVIARLAHVMDDRELLRQATALNRSELPPLLLGPGLVIRCHTLRVDGRADEAVATARAAYSQSPGAPGTRSAPFQLLVLSLLATGHRDHVDPYIAEFQASIEHLENVPLAVADFHQAQALVARADGQPSQIAVHAHDLVASAHRHDFVLLTIDGLELLAEAAAGRNDTVTAARLLGAASAHRDRIGYAARMVPDPATVDALVATLPDREPAGFAEGAALTLSEAVEYAQRTRGARGRPSHGWPSLTPTETKVVELVAEGCTNEDVARRLLMSPATVKTHLTHVYAKTATSNRTELTAKWKDL
jgi:DNA-binding CsgD family transcriptional regulator